MTAPTTSSEPPPSRPDARRVQERLIGMSRGDGLSAVAGLLVFICSFLPQVSATSGGVSYHAHMWHALGLVEVFAVPLLALAVVAFTLLPIQQTAYADADVLGVRPAAWRTVLSLVVAIASVFALFFWGHVASDSNGHIGYGAYLVLVFSLIAAAGAILPTYVPDLRLPLSTLSTPRFSTPKFTTPKLRRTSSEPAVADSTVAETPGTVDGQPPAEPGNATAADQPAWGDARGPDPTATFEPVTESAPQPPAPEPGAAERVSPETAPAEPVFAEPVAAPSVTPPPPPMPFEPFWACFPTVRPLVDPTNTALTIGQVSPEEWYLVTGLDERGASVSTSDGRSGLLLDTSGLIRADQ
ncbi:MAG TPA: hypothetical protein VIJ71_02100 [Mycobacteriales bacterium]